MSNDIQQKAELIKGAYPNSDSWKKKVDGMSEGQILAVYFRLKKNDQV